jgi:hypothetical protein
LNLIKWLPPVLLLMLSACSTRENAPLSAAFLHGEGSLDSPLETSAYRPPPNADPDHIFQGRLELTPSPGKGRIKVLTDWFDYVKDPGLAIPDLPPFSFEFVQDGNDLVPLKRGPQVSTHPHWEFILEPGKVWDRPGDQGWSRVSLPFALQERNANCTHNGLMTFLFHSDGRVSRAAYQVGSETCQYLQIDLWGLLDARYTPGKVEDAGKVIREHREEIAARLPVRPIAELANDHPVADPANFDWFPADEVSTFGFAIDGIHYSGGCSTRYGPYPFCAVLDLPSYSLAKSIFAGAAYLILQQEFPGAGKWEVARYVPECRDARWQGVTLDHLLDMRTGNYQSPEAEVDEFASYETDFMGGETHALKINTSCSLFPRKAQPGETFVYHTSETYIAGTLMNAFLQEQAEARGESPRDIHRDILVKKLLKPLGLSPVTHFTRRSYDEIAQPFSGFGLTLHSDDIARLGLFLAEGSGNIDGEQILSASGLQATLQRTPADTEEPQAGARKRDSSVEAGSPSMRYNNGFWAYRTDLGGACEAPVWIPLMSGYGGISVAILPNNSLFYIFSDKGRFEWLRAAVESNKIRKYCDK